MAYQEMGKFDGRLIASKVFADVFQAYLECSNEIQAVIRDMVQVVNADNFTEEERDAALAKIAEALFPCFIEE